MSALDDLKSKEEYTDVESVIVTYSFYETKARGDNHCPKSRKAAAELAQLRASLSNELRFEQARLEELAALRTRAETAEAVNKDLDTELTRQENENLRLTAALEEAKAVMLESEATYTRDNVRAWLQKHGGQK